MNSKASLAPHLRDLKSKDLKLIMDIPISDENVGLLGPRQLIATRSMANDHGFSIINFDIVKVNSKFQLAQVTRDDFMLPPLKRPFFYASIEIRGSRSDVLTPISTPTQQIIFGLELAVWHMGRPPIYNFLVVDRSALPLSRATHPSKFDKTRIHEWESWGPNHSRLFVDQPDIQLSGMRCARLFGMPNPRITTYDFNPYMFKSRGKDDGFDESKAMRALVDDPFVLEGNISFADGVTTSLPYVETVGNIIQEDLILPSLLLGESHIVLRRVSSSISTIYLFLLVHLIS